VAIGAPFVGRAVNNANTAPLDSCVPRFAFAALQPYCPGFLVKAERNPLKAA
jgi:hypothetical protein